MAAGSLTIRLAELCKVVVVIVLAKVIASAQAPELARKPWPHKMLLVGLGLMAAVMLHQPDLGALLVCGLIGLSILCVALPSWRTVLWAAGSGLAAGVALWGLALHEHQRHRVLVWLRLRDDPLGAGWISAQSIRAVQEGGLFGAGAQSRTAFPQSQTDFVFTVWARDHGFLGTVLLVTLVGLVVLGSLRIAAQAEDRSGQVLAIGLAALVGWQAALGIGMALGLAPLLALPLPLCSYGGTAVVATLCLIGIVVRVAWAAATNQGHPSEDPRA